MEKRLILVGGGAFARELIALSEDISSAGVSIKVTAFLDDSPLVFENFSYRLDYLGKIEHYTPSPDDEFIMAIANPEAKRKFSDLLKSKGAKFAQLIHPTAVIARTAKLGEGVVVCAHAFISADAEVGDLVAINALSSVGHDVKIGSFSTLSAHVDLTGYVNVGEAVFFGSGARVLPHTTIGSGAKIGIGATIMRSVQPGLTMYTQPAKKL